MKTCGLALMTAMLALACAGCVPQKQKDMEAMELKAFYSEVEAKYGKPYKIIQGNKVFWAVWRESPRMQVSPGCGWKGYCIRCERFWSLYKLRFNKESKILLGVESPFSDPLRADLVGDMPTFGIKAQDCLKNHDCRRRAEEACRNLIKARKPDAK